MRGANDGVRLEREAVRRLERRAVEDPNLVNTDAYLETVANERLWDALSDCIDVDERIVGDTP